MKRLQYIIGILMMAALLLSSCASPATQQAPAPAETTQTQPTEAATQPAA